MKVSAQPSSLVCNARRRRLPSLRTEASEAVGGSGGESSDRETKSNRLLQHKMLLQSWSHAPTPTAGTILTAA